MHIHELVRPFMNEQNDTESHSDQGLLCGSRHVRSRRFFALFPEPRKLRMCEKSRHVIGNR